MWPDQITRQSIVEQTKPLLINIPNKIIPDNLHITLAFVGSVEKSQLPCLLKAARFIQTKRFTLSLDKTGCFHQEKIFWLGCQFINPELKNLVTQLNNELKRCDYKPDERLYTPHVSLARQYNSLSYPEFKNKIEWQVDSFSLIESRSTAAGVEYHVLDTWPLN